MKIPVLSLYVLLFIALFTSGCAHLADSQAPAAKEYSAAHLADSKSALFKPLSEERILLSDKSLTALSKTAQAAQKIVPQSDPLLPLKKPLKAPSQSLWQRIADGYSLLPQQDKNKFARTLNTYRTYRRYFSDISKNAAPYLHHIVERIESRGMPLEIALLPAIESAFRPHARSPYHAEGLWQFIPSTGRMFGLQQNSWYDGRRDVMAATDAALDYLQSLHKNLNGNWLHAIAAYNCGEANVRRAIQKNLAQGKATDYWSLDLPKETQAYIPKLMALSEIISNADDYGITLEDIPNQPYLRKIDIGEQIDLKLAAQLADISYPKLQRLNPGFKRSTMSPSGPFYLVLPTEKVDLFRQRLAQTHDKLPNGQPTPEAEADSNTAKKTAADTKHYRIRSGDSLWTIARRHDTSVKTLTQLNRIDKKTRLRIGRTLLVPAPGNTHAGAPSSKTTALLSAASHPQRVHTIRSGDVLGKIAEQYNTSIQALCDLNGISRQTTLRAGQTLLIPATPKARGI